MCRYELPRPCLVRLPRNILHVLIGRSRNPLPCRIPSGLLDGFRQVLDVQLEVRDALLGFGRGL